MVVGTEVARKFCCIATYHIEGEPSSVGRGAYAGSSVAAALGSLELPAALRGREMIWRDLGMSRRRYKLATRVRTYVSED